MEVERRFRQDANYTALLREKAEAKWFAALVATAKDEPFAIRRRLGSWKELLDFLLEQHALVEVWAYPQAGLGEPRRIPAPELAALKRQRQEQPAFITATYREPTTGEVVTQQVEFGFDAARVVLAAHQGYQRHRGLQLAVREFLGARDSNGQFSAIAQWEALQQAVNERRLVMGEMPRKPLIQGNPFVAVEYEVDDQNNFSRVVRAYRESDLEKRVTGDTQVLILKKQGDRPERQALGFRVRGTSDQLEFVRSPVPGQDIVELRIKDPDQTDIRKWSVLEFGEPELVQQSALARFSLLSAHLDKSRKEIAIRKSSLDLIAESIIGGLNVGGGVAGVTFPIGSAARLGYDVLVAPWFIPEVPSVKQMRELFMVLAAKTQHPELHTKPGAFLDEDDIRRLREAARDLTDAQVVGFLGQIDDDDVRGMLRVAKMQHFDARLANLLSIIADAGRVSGWTDEAGFQRDVFNSIFFSVTGDVSIKNIIAALVGGSIATPNAGVSLYDLSRGNGPAEAWLQYLDFTVDIRAVVNTVARLSHRNLADKELKKPFPYAPRMSDFAAYEIRIFGFPLMIFYKRGLMKEDLAAFTHDYAYGMLGARIIEHFPTREAMDAEIRAGRMVPLGYVRVLDSQGHWKETNLAVFAHRVASGKYRGKTTIIIYGLPAYADHSQEIDRELQRFRQFEAGLREGAVIEQLVRAEEGALVPAREFEPVLHVGPKANEELFAPLLGKLLELHRASLRKSLGLPPERDELERIGGIPQAFGANGIGAGDEDPLLAVDRFNSTFVYRKHVAGKWRDVKVTSLPSLADVEQDLRKAEEAARIESMRREAVSGNSAGVVLLNEVREVNGRYEIGPLLHDEGGQAVGAGVTSGARAMERILDLVDQLPVTDRARLRFNHFAATVVELDVNGDGLRRKVFLTIEFPPGEVRRTWTNPVSGERETLIYEQGLWRRAITDRYLVELDYERADIETRSRTFSNRGTRDAPVPGELLEETRTLEVWFRDLSQLDLDPYQPVVSKLRVNYMTGQEVRDTYGLFPLPVQTADDQYITRNRFNPQGMLESATVFENGVTEADFQRPPLTRVIVPIAGRARFELRAAALNAIDPGDASVRSSTTLVERNDLIQGLTRMERFENARLGRKIRESYTDPFDGTRSFPVNVTLEYRDDFHSGLVPYRTATTSPASGKLLAEVLTIGYDPLNRRLTGVEVDYRGKSGTNTYDYRWRNPVEVTTTARRTVNRYNREETSVTGMTTTKSTDEEVASFSGRYEPFTRTWRMERNVWHRPGVLSRAETNLYSGFGRLITTRVGDELETRPLYSADGIEEARQTYLRNPATGNFDILISQQDDYQWQNGACQAHVRTHVEGQPYDDYRLFIDDEGRTTVDRIKQLPGVDLRTIVAFDGESERVLKAETFQNNELRVTHVVQREERQADGTYLLPVKVVPYWGLTLTNTLRLGDPSGRPLSTSAENGDRTIATEYFAGTAIPKVSELSDRDGRVKARYIRRLNAGTEAGLPYDMATRYEVGFWNNTGLAEERAVVRGTDVALFQETDEARIYYDVTRPFESPHYAVDPHGHYGIRTLVNTTNRLHVTGVWRTRFRDRFDPKDPRGAAERVMDLDEVDLHGLFYHPFARHTLDRAGSVLEARMGKIENLGLRGYSLATIFAAVDRNPVTKKFVYRYDPGWVAEQIDPGTSEPVLALAYRPPSPQVKQWRVNDLGWREWPTEIYGHQAVSESLLESADLGRYVFRRIHQPRQLKRNPYLPDLTNVWHAWTSSELDAESRRLFDSELIYNAQGQPSTAVAHKRNSAGHRADKIVYQLSYRTVDTWQSRPLAPGTNTVILGSGNPEDMSHGDFFVFFLERPRATLVTLNVSDASGHTAVVTQGDRPGERSELTFWPMASGQVQWLPNDLVPEHGAVVGAPAFLIQEESVLAVSLPELAKAGLDVRRLTSLVLVLTAAEAGEARLSPLCRLTQDGRFIPDRMPTRFRHDELAHSSGLESRTWTKERRSAREIRTDRGWRSVVKFNGLSVATVNPRDHAPFYPVATILDYSDPDSPRPLYALAPDDGKFLEHYQTFRWGDAQVYTVASGFETPKLEVFRAGILDDEISPGLLAFGYGYYVSVPLAKASGSLTKPLASLHNRVVASAFTLGGDRLFRFLSDAIPVEAELGRFTREVGTASRQAQEINQLPTLAQSLLALRELPWRPGTVNPARDGGLDRNTLDAILLRLARDNPSKLMPTSPNTAAARFVDSAKEGELIQLAVRGNNCPLAVDALQFYVDRSEGGLTPVHAAYDAQTGASLVKDPKYKRHAEASQTAEAQLAIAEAAFSFGVATGDPVALDFGRQLVAVLLTQFRSSDTTAGPRGITERPFRGLKQWHGITLWPEAETYSLRSNARAYLLLKRLDELMPPLPFAAEWRPMLKEAVKEQEAWLRQNIMPQVEKTGVAPKGLSQIQDVHNRTTAYIVERWTSAEDWLVFLEAADQMGVPRATTRSWLENLARVHGVTVKGVWGLDWSIPLRRPDAISTELTARFARLASLLDHQEAASFARRSLTAMGQDGRWPVVVTTTAADALLRTGQGTYLYPTNSVATTGGQTNGAKGWPEGLGVYFEQTEAVWPTNLQSAKPLERAPGSQRDITAFLWTAAGFYLCIVATNVMFWSLGLMRKRRRARTDKEARPGPLLSDLVMQRAEERWAKRVLGACTPPNAERSRFSNGAVEQNFHMQLRAIYKLVLEWRRVVNGWTEDDPRLVEDGSDEWLNGADEFAAMVGVYSRWVIKAGKKDGRRKADVLAENEDSNHLWSRLLMYFSESHWALLELVKQFKVEPAAAEFIGVNAQIELVLRSLGARQRSEPFDGRTAFDVPANRAALDLLIIQLPGANLTTLAEEMERRLGIPRTQLERFILNYKRFKEREQLYPIHPYLIEGAKLLPHFILMGLLALIWYNNDIGGLPIYPYLKEQGLDLILDWTWVLPVLAGFALSLTAYYIGTYRFRERIRSRARGGMVLDTSLTSFLSKAQSAVPTIRASRWFEPVWYERAGWVLRAIGFTWLGVTLLRLDVPSFAIFMFVKGLVATLLLVEAAAVVVPMAVTRLSLWLEDRVSARPAAWPITRFLNQLNLPATRPASLIWLSFDYHFRPSVVTGGLLSTIQAILFYLGFAAAFFWVGGYVYKEVLTVWFKETYQNGWDLGLILGGFLFWNTMYLLRFGLFVLAASVCAALVAYPIRAIGGVLALLYLGWSLWDSSVLGFLTGHPLVTCGLLATGLFLMLFEPEFLAWLETGPVLQGRQQRRQQERQRLLQQVKTDQNRILGVVYMSGDDLSFHKLTPELMMTRLRILRDALDSDGLRLISALHPLPDDQTLTQWFRVLYETEKKHDVTLWHPLQMVLPGEKPRLPGELGLNLVIDSPEQRTQLLATWHIRRWTVTMMSTAGHSQDTGVNLVDIGLRLGQEGLGANVVFYLIQNKYDNNDNNRPSQTPYDKGELGQRNKLARLLMELVPGTRAYSVNDWTPFGFKAGGLVGMDLVHEESLKLTNMLVLDRNANTHDLDALMEDITTALVDPGVVIIIPGRGTTNTRTPLGQASQQVEEGHRAQIRGLMLMGGNAGETLGTGWGNIQAVYYGRVQRALVDPDTPKMPLSSRMQRGASFSERFEGLIGFGPHAVGISEDIWGVTQTAHNAIALGNQVKFERSHAFWHKIRETWSHAEWFSAFPRWSGGYLQMMLDPIMQRISDYGPVSVFAKELRANGGRFFLTAPFALLNILLMPLAIIWNVSPFIQILIVLWNFGFVMNQVMTGLGLIACLESTGFYKLPALLGAGLAGIGCALDPVLRPYAPGLIALGLLGGGFAVGLGRWVYDRGRDVLLFGPQLVIHALGQAVRQSLEFVLSGASANDAKGVNIAFRAWAGPREDRPFEGYQNIINLRTVVWGMGLLSLALNLFALSNLDFLNVVLLLPSLLFSVSTLVGPFVLIPRVGRHLGGAVWIPKLLGWVGGFTFYSGIAWLVARGGWREWLGVLLFVACFGRVLQAGLRYVRYPQRLRRVVRRLRDLLVLGGLGAKEAEQLTQHLVRNLGGDLEKIKAALQRTALSPDHRDRVLQQAQAEVLPVLRQPVADLQTGRFAQSRFVSELSRSFVLALFVLLWFFVVPIPGLLVFQAADYRASMTLRTLILILSGTAAFALLAAWLGRLLERWVCRPWPGHGLLARIERSHGAFQSLTQTPGLLSASEASSLYALFTDVQTYVDQHSYAYARRSLRLIDRILGAASGR